MISSLLHQATVLVGCVTLCQRLSQARWTRQAPRVAVLLWQLLLAATLLAAIGIPLQLALARYDSAVPVAIARLVTDLAAGHRPAPLDPLRLALLTLAVGTAAALVCAMIVRHLHARSIRRRHLDALALVARQHPATADAVIVDHAGAMAYCVPGTSVIVISAGTVNALSQPQLAAVIAHEQAHLRERHDLVLLPFATLQRLLPASLRVRQTYESVALLVEMCADDRAAQRHGRTVVHDALRGFATAAPLVPRAAMGASTGLTERLRRLATPHRTLPAAARALVLTAGLLAVVTPVSTLCWPS